MIWTTEACGLVCSNLVPAFLRAEDGRYKKVAMCDEIERVQRQKSNSARNIYDI